MDIALGWDSKHLTGRKNSTSFWRFGSRGNRNQNDTTVISSVSTCSLFLQHSHFWGCWFRSTAEGLGPLEALQWIILTFGSCVILVGCGMAYSFHFHYFVLTSNTSETDRNHIHIAENYACLLSLYLSNSQTVICNVLVYPINSA